MIDEKKIAKTATLYAKETWNHEEEQFVAMCAFKEGTLWAQQEFPKTLWHDASEEPKDDAEIIVSKRSGYTIIRHSAIANWDSYRELVNIKCWCYISDILPKEGGEE